MAPSGYRGWIVNTRLRFGRQWLNDMPEDIDYGDIYSHFVQMASDGQLPVEVTNEDRHSMNNGGFPNCIDRLFFQLFGLQWNEEWVTDYLHQEQCYVVANEFLGNNDVRWLFSQHAPTLIRAKLSQMNISQKLKTA